MTNPTQKIEELNSIPIILEIIKKMQIIPLLDNVCRLHKNWKGMSIGETIAIWLCYILTQNDHRMCSVEEWVAKKQEILSQYFKQPISPKHFTDDRLARILDFFSDSELWNEFESKLNQSVLRIYDFSSNYARIDMTTANSGGIVTESGLLQFGHSKDDPNRPQIKIALSVLDPLGLPLTVSVHPGNTADDPLYVPEMAKVLQNTPYNHLLFVGDCKMSALATRVYAVANEVDYLCPLTEVAHPPTEMIKAIRSFQNTGCDFTQVKREYYDGDEAFIAEGFEKTVIRLAIHDELEFSWEERLIYAKSFAYAESQKVLLESRVNKAQDDILQMNKRGRGRPVYSSSSEAESKIQAILGKYSVTGLISCEIQETVTEKCIRAYGNKPARVEKKTEITVTPTINQEAYEAAIQCLGWRVYATNRSDDELSLESVVLAYRDQYIIEHAFQRLKGKCLSLSPIHIQKDERIDGLVKLLTIPLRILVLIDKTIQDCIAKRGKKLSGLFRYNPKKEVSRPKAERIIEFFEGIYASFYYVGELSCTLVLGLESKHREILELLNMSEEIFTAFGEIQDTMI